MGRSIPIAPLPARSAARGNGHEGAPSGSRADRGATFRYPSQPPTIRRNHPRSSGRVADECETILHYSGKFRKTGSFGGTFYAVPLASCRHLGSHGLNLSSEVLVKELGDLQERLFGFGCACVAHKLSVRLRFIDLQQRFHTSLTQLAMHADRAA
jgi:hypothetical protein